MGMFGLGYFCNCKDINVVQKTYITPLLHDRYTQTHIIYCVSKVFRVFLFKNYPNRSVNTVLDIDRECTAQQLAY